MPNWVAFTATAGKLVLVGRAVAAGPSSQPGAVPPEPSAGPRARLPGIRFAVDTAETPAPARGAFKTFAGVVEFAAGRGRLDVTAAPGGPAIAVNGVTIGAPLGSSG